MGFRQAPCQVAGGKRGQGSAVGKARQGKCPAHSPPWLAGVTAVPHGEGNTLSPLFQQAFTIMDQNRDGFIDKADLRDTFAALGELAAVRGTGGQAASAATEAQLVLECSGGGCEGHRRQEETCPAWAASCPAAAGLLHSSSWKVSGAASVGSSLWTSLVGATEPCRLAALQGHGALPCNYFMSPPKQGPTPGVCDLPLNPGFPGGSF